MGFSPGFSNAGAKARDPDRYFSGALKRSSPHKCGGSHHEAQCTPFFRSR